MKRLKEEEEHGPKEIWETSTGSAQGSEDEKEDTKMQNDQSSVNQPTKSPQEKKQHGNKKAGKSRKEEEEEEDDILPGDVDADEKKAWRRTSVSQRRRLRRYQLNRLKYFYAIAEFDSAETAAAVYEACDGVEYGSTGIRFDLRFVDDSETFSTPAVHSTRITLTWDKTPAARTEWLREQFETSADPKTTLTQRKDEVKLIYH
ncbi:unnamed protein product [Dibothriocephalus latus]|uniref:ESF1 RRM domain-containing protein n=1 Tax=Dibothriocephalus latus TaxID=60516 RepID=A0A3P7LDZ4_DIBLA|nr:unnamed protein product [Dibothriocephalus latus]